MSISVTRFTIIPEQYSDFFYKYFLSYFSQSTLIRLLLPHDSVPCTW
jgi:hypothetical protein